MKASYIILIIASLFMSASVEVKANGSALKSNAGGDSKNAKSGVKEKTPLNSDNVNKSVSSETDFSYLRFDVTKYEGQDLQESGDASSDIQVTDNEFNYLKFDVGRYDKNENNISEEIDETVPQSETDFNYLRFDVTKYPADDEDTNDNMLNY